MLTSREIAKKWEGTARSKAELPPQKCLALGFLAGAFIALGALGSSVIQVGVGGGLGRLLGACAFPAGLMLVVMAGGELFTGNCLMAGPAANGAVRWRDVLRNWLFVYLGNMAGALFVALTAYWGGLYGTDAMTAAIQATASSKCSLSFVEALARGIGCNILVCGAVWMASGAENAAGKAVCCFFPVMLFVVCGLEHSVANMYYIPLGMLPPGTAGVPAYLFKNLLPVTLGNIIGGAGLSVLYAKIYRD